MSGGLSRPLASGLTTSARYWPEGTTSSASWRLRASLRADQSVGGDADGPAQPRGHADDLVGGMDRGGAPDLRDRRHLLDSGEHLHADLGGLKPQHDVNIGDHGGK